MPRFAYTARDPAGAVQEGEIEAPSRKEVVRLLSARRLQASAVTEATGGTKRAKPSATPAAGGADKKRPAVKLQFGAASTPRRAERLAFLESLHDLTTSGLSAGEAVRLLSIRIKDPRLRTLSVGLWTRVSEGAPLSRAMADFPKVFDTSTVNLIQAGEATGSLNDTTARLISHLTLQRDMRQKLLMALAYPVVMILVAIGVILFFLFFLLPRLQTLLASLGGDLPVSTKILIAIATFALRYGVFIVAAVVLAAISFWRWRATEAGRARSDAWLLRLPLIGPFSVAQSVLEFSQTLSVLLENGINASEALHMTERQISNRVHRKAFREATERVLEGEALSLAIGRTGCFPDLVLDRLAVGENTGNIVPSLKAVGVAYQKIITDRLGAFTGIITSGVLLTVFAFVGFIAFAIVSAVFQVSAGFKIS